MQPLAVEPTHAVNSTGCQLHAKLLRFGNALRTQRGTWSFAAGALPAMTTARLAQPVLVERKVLNLVVVGSGFALSCRTDAFHGACELRTLEGLHEAQRRL